MKVVVIIVIRRSLSFSTVRDPITPGTPQPVPISIGIKDFPERPNLRKTRSMMKATLAIYPHPSKKARKRKKVSICGKKPSTAPRPATIPSITRPCKASFTFMDSRRLVTAPGMDGRSTSPKKDHGSEPKSTSFTQSVIFVPTVEMEI